VVTRVGLVTIDRKRTGKILRQGRSTTGSPRMDRPPERVLKVAGGACRPIRLASDLKVYKLHDFNRRISRREHEPRFPWNPRDFET
jgi:hypothetical protein